MAGANNGITYTVTNSGSGAYLINSASNPPLTVIRGMTYIFQINAAGHPFWLQTTSGSYNASNIYSKGVTDNGKAVGTISWQVPFDAPNTVYYICQLHSSMNGQINVSDAGPVGPQGLKGEVGEQGIQGFTGVAGPAPSGTGIVTVVSGTLQTPSGLTGDVTTTGAGLETTIGNGKVTNTMLAGSIELTSKVTGILPSSNGGTGNGFTTITGPTTSLKTFTLPDASATILTSNAAVSVAQGGTGTTTLVVNNVLLGNGTSAVQVVAPGTSGNVLTSNGTTWTSATPAAGLPSTGNTAGDMLYWDGSAWVLVATTTFEGAFLQMIGGIPTWTNGTSYPIGSVFGPSGPTPVVEVIGAGGRIWMDRNLGATQRATSATDANSYGDLYQWGRGADGHQLRTSATTSTLSSIDNPGNGDFILVPSSPYNWRSPQNVNLWQGLNGVNNPCPRGFRIPTIVEWEEEYKKWSSESAEGAYASPLRLPRTGWRSSANNTFTEVGINGVGVYWSSTLGSSELARAMNIRTDFLSTGHSRRAHGFAVRCIKD